MNKFAQSALVAAALLVGAGAQAQNLVGNGSFESLSVPDNSSVVVTSLPSWTLTGTTRLFNPLTNTPEMEGNNYLQIVAGGSATQGLSFTAGTLYTLTFGYKLNANSAGSFTINGNTVNLASNSGTYSYTFTANGSAPANVSFASSSGRMLLDNVTVTAVPEPATAGMLLAGLAVLAARRRQRKNQA